MNEQLQEFVHSQGAAVRVDREAGIIHGVKILGLTSRNGRTYMPAALEAAAALYEDAKVNVNHPKGAPGGPRDYQDRIGTIRNVTFRGGEGLFAEFHFNPKHALAEQLVWDAQHAPENVGFSHNVEARTQRRGEQVVVEAITKVQSVDLVADPATTRGLYETAQRTAAGWPSVVWAALDATGLQEHRPDLVDALREEQTAEIVRLREEVGRLQAAAQRQERQTVIRRLLGEYQLPDPDAADAQARVLVGGSFWESLLAAADDAAVRQLIEERVRLLRAAGRLSESGTARPKSRSQSEIYAAAAVDVKGFLAAIT